ncbi:MAG: Stealth CR1 domain-containing protein [Lachnospiraceae bacterium]|nr:Stealth CR1 domain-containing protein [Lachnospiraceae bacterium]
MKKRNMQTNEPIDFVILWVDGADTAWLAEKRKYDGSDEKGDSSEVRFRSWDNLQYWFRGVEKFAPWVRTIHFVTWGHLPPWLDTTNPKLHIVNHKDYIPEKYLPTFNANTIELNLHRIEGLAEQFVYFNDDMFVTAPVKPEDFFRDGKPRDAFGLNCIYFGKKSAGFFNGNDVELINIHFDKKECMKKNRRKWFTLRNGWKCVARTLLLAYAWNWFPGFYYDHLPTDFVKSTFEKVWAEEGEVLDATCMDKFRTKSNCNQWLMKFWQLAEGNFDVRSRDFGKCFHIKDRTFPSALKAIREGQYPLICLNDTIYTSNFEKQKEEAIKAFQTLLPEKSSFEV